MLTVFMFDHQHVQSDTLLTETLEEEKKLFICTLFCNNNTGKLKSLGF